MSITSKPGTHLNVGDSVFCNYGEGADKRTGLKATILSKIDSVIGYVFMAENTEEKWVATAFFLRPDDVELTCPMIIRYGEEHVAKNRQQAINVLKGEPAEDPVFPESEFPDIPE